MRLLVKALSVRMELSSRRFEETGCLLLHVLELQEDDSLFESSYTTDTETRNHIPAMRASIITDPAAQGGEGII
jgi:hypothetical protein